MMKMKKFASLLLALVLCVALAAPAFAASGTNDNSGAITITGTVKGQTYTPYQILVLQSYDTDAKTYVYTAHSAWAAWLATQTTYVAIDGEGHVTWKEGASAASFAKAAIEHVKTVNGDSDTTNDIAPAQTGVTAATDNEEIVFSGLNLGYYLIDSTLGALCSLDTTRPSVIISEKNYETTIDKKVNRGETNMTAPAGYDYVEEVAKQIGTVVDFAVVVNFYPGAENYTFHDSMSEGLTYIDNYEVDGVTYKTEVWTYPMNSASATKLDSAYYTVNDAPTCSHDGKACDFTITFSKEYLDSIDKHVQLTVRYFAILNEKAVTYHEDENGNINFAKLIYGDGNETEWDPAVVQTYSFQIVKTDVNDKVITGAKFALYDAKTGGNLIPLVSLGNKNYPELDAHCAPTGGTIALPAYRPATPEEIKAAGFVSAEIEVGRAVVEGLPLGVTYYLEETVAPHGYTILNERVSVLLTQHESTKQVMINGSSDHMAIVLGDVYMSGGVEIENRSGTILPATGGIGTTIFYALGGVMVLGALVLFLTKRRMAVEG